MVTFLVKFFLLSGIFLGWSLGANDAANVFGSAVGSRMVKFRTGALIAIIFDGCGHNFFVYPAKTQQQ